MSEIIRFTRSVCPVCLKNIPAVLRTEESGRIVLQKTCPDHGFTSVPVWQGEIGTCCALLEVTKRCNLRCTYCFADGGQPEPDPELSTVKAAIQDIARQCGSPLLQLSGGEPTMRDDLPELVRFAKEAGCSYVQLNTNGIRLAEDPAYAEALAEAGLDIVFLQFDGTRDDIYKKLRGRPLLKEKRKAIGVCSDLHLGVTLVPTVVRGVNDDNLGELISLACSLAPGVRGIHFQPVSYFGRVPHAPGEEDRYTLDRLMADISDQAGIPMESFMPSRCDHPLCGFHADFLIRPGGGLKPLSSITHSSGNMLPGTGAGHRRNLLRKETFLTRWILTPSSTACGIRA